MDFEELINGLAGVLQSQINGDLKKMKDYAREIIQNRKTALEELASLFLSGKITPEELASEIEDEKKVMEAQIEAMTGISKAAAQKATNAALGYIQDYLLKLI